MTSFFLSESANTTVQGLCIPNSASDGEIQQSSLVCFLLTFYCNESSDRSEKSATKTLVTWESVKVFQRFSLQNDAAVTADGNKKRITSCVLESFSKKHLSYCVFFLQWQKCLMSQKKKCVAKRHF